MKSKVKILKTSAGYVGYIMQNDEVVYETPPCRDGITASRALSNYTGARPAGSSTGVTVGGTTLKSVARSASSGKCCGR